MNIFEKDIFNGKVIAINSTVPEFIEIKDRKNGKGLFVKKSFKKGEILYTTNCFKASYEELNEEIILKTNVGEFILLRDVHPDGVFLYGLDSFLNHSCNKNMFDFFQDKDGTSYVKAASRDIEIGDELLVNYNEFIWDMERDSFDCKCGFENCHGVIKGFKFLSKENQHKILDSKELCEYIRNYFEEKLKSES